MHQLSILNIRSPVHGQTFRTVIRNQPIVGYLKFTRANALVKKSNCHEECAFSGHVKRWIVRSSPKNVQESTPTPETMLDRGKLLLLFLVSASGLYLISTSPLVSSLKNSVMSSWLGKSGFVASMSLIFLSEIGDKTFFICVILAMRLGRWISFLGTITALAAMTFLSVGIGVAFNAVPDAMKTSIPIGKYFSVALLLFFGVRNLLTGFQSSEADKDGNEEFVGAQERVDKAAVKGTISDNEVKSKTMDFRGRLRAFLVVVALVFVAEWGDRSMLTTIALGASQSPVGVALGGVIGHILAAIIAIVGGSLVSNFISEKTIHLVSGIFFMIFAITTTLNWT